MVQRSSRSFRGTERLLHLIRKDRLIETIIGDDQNRAFLFGQAAGLSQCFYGLDRVAYANRLQLATIDQLQELHKKLDLAFPAGEHFHGNSGLNRRSIFELLAIAIDFSLEGSDTCDVRSCQIAAINEAWEFLQ